MSENGHVGDLSDPQALTVVMRMIEFLKADESNEFSTKVVDSRVRTIVKILWEFGRLDELNWFLTKYASRITLHDVQSGVLNQDFVTQVCAAAQGDGKECWQKFHHDLLTHSLDLNTKKIAALNSPLSIPIRLKLPALSKKLGRG